MYLLFDIGGTKTRIATSKGEEDINKPVVFPTPKKFEDFVEIFSKKVKKMISDQKIKKAAGGIPGALNKDKNRLLKSPNLPKWINQNLKKRLENAIKAPISFENDADIVGLGEHEFGAAQNYGISVYMTISTGVGGTRIVEGKIDKYTQGFEPGHQIINTEAKALGTKKYAELEDLVSGSSLKQRFGKDPRKIKDSEIWKEIEEYIAVGLNNTIVHWSPDVAVIGGGVSNDLNIKNIKSNLEEIMTIFPTVPDIKRAKLEDVGGLYGALAYLRD